ncbi:MAG TPA: TonB-dependent receptor [Chitinophaga sp.]|uniref:SusC/RagA family TonB-linked outer membrane protein n=1 Tax=Chitinophaga sp. TaxID=1869181 RepID=UPI002DB86B92|nr:TonB-dependent receptor [Chitinophaga sp.]HEU4552354.1 TonB-dependent receptor [Chitinophaga sp.]
MRVTGTHKGKTLLVLALAATFTVQAQDLVYRRPQPAHADTPQLTQKTGTLPLKSALQQLEKTYRINFAYNARLVADKQVPASTLDNSGSIPLATMLKTLLTPLELQYTQVDSALYVIKPLDISGGTNANAYTQITGNVEQAAPVKGKVTDNTGTPLIGVTIRVKGTTTGTTTGPDGTYTVNVPEGNDTLQVSYLGYLPQEIGIADRTTVDIVMQTSESQLEQVVVVGYGTQRKRDLTGAISSVKGEDLAKQPVLTATQAAQGRIAGVQIISSGQPNTQPQIRVRGTGSVMAGANPLYVVDGVLTDDIRNINSADIVSMDVLKDASAAIYGVRAANGVVIITTRKGRAGKTEVRYDGNVGFREASNLVKMANRNQYIDYLKDAAPSKDPVNDAAVYPGSTNWYDAVLRKAFEMNHNISVSGGTDKHTYFFSGGYIQDDGIIKTNTFRRFTLRANNEINISDQWKFSTQLSYSRGTGRAVDLNGIYGNIYRAAPVIIPEQDGRYGNTSAWGNVANPLLSLDKKNYRQQDDRLQGNVALDFTPVKALRFHSAFNADLRWGNDRIYQYKFLNDDKTFLVAGGNQRVDNSQLTIGDFRSQGWVWDNTVTFDQDFGKHALTLLAGSVTEGFYSTFHNGSRINVPESEDLWYLDLGNPDVQSKINNGGDKYARQSFVGRVNYSYDNRYLLSASIRADGSSKFRERWGYFPTVGVGWVISQEPFMQSQHVFSFLKLRGSWGILGNDNIPTNAYINTATVNLPYFYDGAISLGSALQETKDLNLKWESTNQFDVGFEFTLLKERLSGEVDYYNKKTKDALTVVNIPSILGDPNNTYITNAASFKNTGYEISLNWKDNITKDLGYSVGGNITFNKNEITNLAGGQALLGGNVGQQSFVTRTDNGYPVASFYVLQSLGIFQSQEEIDNYKDKNGNVIQPGARPGDLKYQDYNGDGVIDDNDKQFVGSYQPKFYYGFNVGLNFKGFDLTADFYGNGGNKIYNGKKAFRYENTDNIEADYADKRWKPDRPSATDPALLLSSTPASTYFVESGAFLRCNNLTVGYSLPSDKLKAIGITRFRVYLTSQNLFTLKKFSGFSPELPGGTIDFDNSINNRTNTRSSTANSTNNTSGILDAGIELNAYPTTRTFAFGVNVSF